LAAECAGKRILKIGQ